MSSITKALIIIAIAALTLFIIIEIIHLLINNKHFEARKISLNTKWVNDAFYDCAQDYTEQQFDRLGKPIETKKGDYRVDFVTELNRTAAAMINTCCEGDKLSNDFCQYIERAYPAIRRKDLGFVISDYMNARQLALQNKTDVFLNSIQDITPEEFFEIRNRQKGDIVGVYIIHNETNDKYYVGQAKKLFFRINQHFTGHGNGDVYADYRFGDDFSIKIIKLSDSGYDDIDKLEKDMIEKYNAYSSGYNRTSGNY